jgi:hypothetical protein
VTRKSLSRFINKASKNFRLALVCLRVGCCHPPAILGTQTNFLLRLTGGTGAARRPRSSIRTRIRLSECHRPNTFSQLDWCNSSCWIRPILRGATDLAEGIISKSLAKAAPKLERLSGWHRAHANSNVRCILPRHETSPLPDLQKPD